MRNFFRKLIVIFAWASLLLVPYSLVAWACYAGLCGGGANGEIRVHYGSFFAYFAFGYLLICLFALITYSFNQRLRQSGWILILPYLALLPFIYVEFKVNQIQTAYQQRVDEYYQPHAEDYICVPGKFIRAANNRFLYFQVKDGMKVVRNYESLQAIVTDLQKQGLTLSQCKNVAGTALSTP